MRYSKKIEKAIKTATTAHDGQYRKSPTSPKLPYISHLFSVATIISEHSSDEDLIVAGLLHDILEDTDFSKDELISEFGEKVHMLVDAVTESTLKEKTSMTWREKKENYLKKLKSGPKEASIIASADKIHNLISSIDSKIKLTRDHEDYAWYHREVFEIVSQKLGDHPIVDKHRIAMKEAGNAYREGTISS